LAKAQEFFGMKYEGRTHDTGSKLGFLVANAAYALENDELAGPFRRELEALLKG
ncbi:MAG: UTP--glucose-phosphate uridylyltransferase, partial [Sphingomonadales bacterium]|nr:UTP--glucose-phosphate uridylyltransferase [Sphingomonadales bacterium]